MGSPTRNFYLDAFARQGFGEAAREVQRLWLDGRREEAADGTLELALKTDLLGTEEAVRERLLAYRAAGVSTLRAAVRGDTLSRRVEALERLIALVRDVEGAAE